MIDYETFCRLRQLRDEQGLKISQIAAQLGLDPKTGLSIRRNTHRVCGLINGPIKVLLTDSGRIVGRSRQSR
jgi:transcriptional regulator with XRE-family HTH domain